MLEIFILGLVKVLDNVISTAKNITTYQNKKLLTSLLVIVSQFMFYFIVKSIVEDGSLASTIVICVCSGLGTYITMFFNERFQKDVTYMNILTCGSIDKIDDLCRYLLSNNITCVPLDSYGLEGERTKTIIAFARTKYESKLIDEFLKSSETKYMRRILH